MHTLFAGIHIQNKPKEILELSNVDFEKSVLYLKEEIAKRLEEKANLEIIYNGQILNDELKIAGTVPPNGTVHCFIKTKQYTYQKSTFDDAAVIASIQELFNVIAHIQISVNSRVVILQKILAEYPEFRRNLGAQALIRDSVLFNTLHQPEVINNIAKHYPIICEAAPFIVDTIKKELKRSTTSNYSEPATDSTNSSEEENSLGPSSSSGAAAGGSQSLNAQIRTVTRQQLQTALAQIGASFNSLSSIAQRNTDTSAAAAAVPVTSTPIPTSASGERISSELFRNELERAFNSLNQPPAPAQQMDTTETSAESSTPTQTSADENDIPARYRNHQYAAQLRTMAAMGLVSYEENLVFLNLTNGDIENAVNLLMGAMN